MAKLVMFIMLLHLAVGCGKGLSSVEDPVVNMPAEVQVYYEEFFQVVDVHLRNAGTIYLGETPVGVAAYCTHRLWSPWTIVLSEPYWVSLRDDGKRALVFHELTHCTFSSSEHSTDPYSYMYTSANIGLSLKVIDNQLLQWIAHL